MNKWIAEFELEDGDTMPEHMDLEYKGVRIDFHCKPLEQEPNCSEIPRGSTTKNCRSCRNFGSHHGICEICKDNKCWTEKEPTADNDSAVDCISRQAVLEQAYAYGNGLEPDGYCVNVEDIQALPSVTPQPKHGIWQQTNKNEVNVIPEYKCSECGAEYKGFGFDFDYCPRCGCAMEVEE